MNKPVHIGIDANEANVENRVGSNRYAYEIIQALYDLDTEHTVTIYTRSAVVADMPKERKNWQYRVLKPARLWTQWRFPLDLYTHFPRPDVIFSPGHYAPRFSPVPYIVSIMDLAFLRYPEMFMRYKRGTAQLKSWTEYSVKHASQVIAISNYTKQDIHQNYDYPLQNIHIAYPGIDRQFFAPASAKQTAAVLQKYRITQPYLLHVGTLQPRKNLLRLLQAFEHSAQSHASLQLVLAGQKGWLYEEFFDALEKSPYKDRVIITGFVDWADLPALYTGAEASCNVGLLEGFGIPAAEALSCGCLPIVAHSSSLPEVVGEAGILVNPTEVTDISKAIEQVLQMSKSQKEQCLAAGMKHIESFSWKKSAEIILQVIEKVAQDSPN